MSPIAPVIPTAPSVSSDLRNELKRFSIEEYHQIVNSGALVNNRVELLEGWIVNKMTHNPKHAATLDRLNETLRKRVPADWRVRVQSSITLSISEPEPDLVIAVGPEDRYEDHHPSPSEIVVVMEVSDSSLRKDRETKKRIYAFEGISVYWIVNIQEKVIEVFSRPESGDYKMATRYSLGADVPLSIAAGVDVAVPVSAILK